jgi:hypothetical protein
LQQFVFHDQSIGVLNKKVEEIESLGSERHARARAGQQAPAWIERKVPEVVQAAHRNAVSL